MNYTDYYTGLEDSWRDAVDVLTDRLETPNIDSDGLRRDLNRVIDAALQQTRTDWEPGDACAECGSSELARWVTFPELTHQEDGYVTFKDGSNVSTEFAWDCYDCDTVMAVSPAALLMPALPGDPPGDNRIPALRDALDHHAPTTDWRGGEACPICESNMIGEEPIDAYPVTAHGDSYTQGHLGERMITPDCWCDACGEQLRQTYGALLSDNLPL